MVIGVLRVLIVIITICCLGLQFSAIAASAGVASKYADADSMHWLYAVAAVLIVACFEFALVPLWRLLTLVEKRDVFSGKAMRWVNHILVYAGIEGMLVLAVVVGQIWLSPSRFLMAAMGVDGQMFPYVVLAVGVAALILIAAFELLLVGMRSLLMQATEPPPPMTGPATGSSMMQAEASIVTPASRNNLSKRFFFMDSLF